MAIANTIGEAWVLIQGDTRGLKRHLDQAKSMTNSAAGAMESRLQRVGATMTTMGKAMTLGVTLPLIAYMGVAVKKAMEAEKATHNLNAALKANGAYSKKASEDLNKFAESLMKVTVYDDEAIKSGMALAINLKDSAKGIKEVTTAGIGLAAMFNMPLEKGMRVAALGSKGIAARLRLMGIELKKGATDVSVWAEVSGKGAKGFQQAMSFAANTTEGQMMQLKNAMDEIAEKIGNELLPALDKIVKALQKIVDLIDRLPKGKLGDIIMGTALIGPPALGIGKLLGIGAGGAAAGAGIGAAAASGGGAGAGGLASRVPGIAKLLAGHVPEAVAGGSFWAGLGSGAAGAAGVGMMAYGARGMIQGASASSKWAAKNYPGAVSGVHGSPFTPGSYLDIQYQTRFLKSIDRKLGNGVPVKAT